MFQACTSNDKCNDALSGGRSPFNPRVESYSDEANALSAVSLAKAPAEKRVSLTAQYFLSPDNIFRGVSFPNDSVGKFIAQTTVAYGSIKELSSGESAAGLEFLQPKAQVGEQRFFFKGVYDSTINGLSTDITDAFGDHQGVPMAFSNTRQIDLRIEQTDTQLIFSARKTPANQSDGGWVPVCTLDVPLDPAPFHIFIGMVGVQKGGKMYFTNFALDGDAIGGEVEYSVIAHLRTSVETIRSAQAKINLASPDLPGALADVDAAIAANNAGVDDIQTGIVDHTFQRGRAPILARKSLTTVTKDLAAARAALALQDQTKAKAQLAKLDTVAGAQMSTMALMLGWKTPNLKAAPQNIFSFRIP